MNDVMKFKVTMKDPDGVFDSVRYAAWLDVQPLGLPEDEAEILAKEREEKINKLLSKWFSFLEYITIEIDTDTGTATVQETPTF